MLTPVLICKQAIIGIDNKLDSNDACMIRGNSLAFHSESSILPTLLKLQGGS